MKYFDNLSQRLNRNQKIIVSIVVPLVLLIIALAIIDDNRLNHISESAIIWISFFVLAGYFEYKMWGNQDKNS